jgi:hypothetical protein
MPPRTLLALCRPVLLRKEELSSGCKTDCEDALLILPGRKRIRSEPSSALNQLNNEHNDGNHEQKFVGLFIPRFIDLPRFFRHSAVIRSLGIDLLWTAASVCDHRLGYQHARRTDIIAAFNFLHHIFADDFQ